MQKSFSDLEYAAKRKVTKRERLLGELEAITPQQQGTDHVFRSCRHPPLIIRTFAVPTAPTFACRHGISRLPSNLQSLALRYRILILHRHFPSYSTSICFAFLASPTPS